MKKFILPTVLLGFLVSCGGDSEQISDESHEEDLENVEEEAGTILEDREYELNELFDLHATIENPDDWVGENVKVWFVLSDDQSVGTINDEEMYVLPTIVDTLYFNMRGGKTSLSTTPEFYSENPDLTFKAGDTVHASGVFDYSLFKEPRVENLVDVK
ncbi:MAG: hypothetical protein ACI857_000647 [Arenicella sp.]|jgi:hypothetical protein